jgi:hypothetical protein
MPTRINGIGTTLPGARDFRADGTYTTTEWATVLYVPLVPLRGLRILPVHKPGLQFLGSWKYHTIEESRPNLRQVLSVYGCWTLFMCSFWPQSQWDRWWRYVPLIAVLASLARFPTPLTRLRQRSSEMN